jgi:leucyl aminopeptidase (aminopeptidase T)
MDDMNTEQFFRDTLQDLADNGSDKARFALSMSKNISSNDSYERNIKARSSLKLASSYLMQALSHNDIAWSRATDRTIKQAQLEIMEAVSLIGS